MITFIQVSETLAKLGCLVWMLYAMATRVRRKALLLKLFLDLLLTRHVVVAEHAFKLALARGVHEVGPVTDFHHRAYYFLVWRHRRWLVTILMFVNKVLDGVAVDRGWQAQCSKEIFFGNAVYLVVSPLIGTANVEVKIGRAHV